eukprot:6065602-Prymnesium_polylepis.1
MYTDCDCDGDHLCACIVASGFWLDVRMGSDEIWTAMDDDGARKGLTVAGGEMGAVCMMDDAQTAFGVART